MSAYNIYGCIILFDFLNYGPCLFCSDTFYFPHYCIIAVQSVLSSLDRSISKRIHCFISSVDSNRIFREFVVV